MKISFRISAHIVTLAVILASARYLPKTTGYLGYIHITVYFALSVIIPETTYTTTLRTLYTGIGLSFVSAALMDNSWLVSSLLNSVLAVLYWTRHGAFLDTALFDFVRAGADTFILVSVIGYSTSYYKRMMFL